MDEERATEVVGAGKQGPNPIPSSSSRSCRRSYQQGRIWGKEPWITSSAAVQRPGGVGGSSSVCFNQWLRQPVQPGAIREQGGTPSISSRLEIGPRSGEGCETSPGNSQRLAAAGGPGERAPAAVSPAVITTGTPRPDRVTPSTAPRQLVVLGVTGPWKDRMEEAS